MLVDDIGDVTITNDGATILRLLEVEHPAAKVGIQVCGNRVPRMAVRPCFCQSLYLQFRGSCMAGAFTSIIVNAALRASGTFTGPRRPGVGS